MRKFIHLSGSQNWCLETLDLLLESAVPIDRRIICCAGERSKSSNRLVTTLSILSKRSDIEHHLGTQCSVLAINCFDGFNPELFCALTGTVESPGIVVLVTPQIDCWPGYPDPDYVKVCSYPFKQQHIKGRFISYFITKLKAYEQSEAIIHLSEAHCDEFKINLLKTDIYNLFHQTTSTSKPILQFNNRHRQVIQWLTEAAADNRPAVLILSGKRGRGKSTVLGTALGKLYEHPTAQAVTTIVVSQTRANIKQLFRQIDKVLSQSCADKQHSKLQPLVKHLAPDQFLKSSPLADLLIIDEAAAVPLPQLLQMINRYDKIVLSTTIDGYEGSGMGFNTKLTTLLKKMNHRLTQIELIQPFRWPDGDLIEQLLTDSLLCQNYNTNNREGLAEFDINQLCIKKLDRSRLVADSKRVDEIYALLAQAHYRTTPDDLRYMLDAPEVELWAAYHAHYLCAVMMVGTEGGIEEELLTPIWLGRRRLRGHLIPQSLSAQSGFRSAPKYSYKRIIRLAVCEPYRKLGIGSTFLRSVMASMPRTFEIDFFGVSYGYDYGLFNFWQRLGFSPVRLGHRANARSGLKSIVMLKAVSIPGRHLAEQLQHQFFCDVQFLTTMGEPVMLSPCLHRVAMAKYRDYLPIDEIKFKSDLYSFAFGNRQFADCHRQLHLYSMHALNQNGITQWLSETQLSLLSHVLLNKTTWSEQAIRLGYTGKKEATAMLRRIFRILYYAHWGNKS